MESIFGATFNHCFENKVDGSIPIFIHHFMNDSLGEIPIGSSYSSLWIWMMNFASKNTFRIKSCSNSFTLLIKGFLFSQSVLSILIPGTGKQKWLRRNWNQENIIKNAVVKLGYEKNSATTSCRVWTFKNEYKVAAETPWTNMVFVQCRCNICKF